MTEKQSKKKLLVVSGPTAVGKTSLALKLAKKFGGELVSADSRQVYKKMDIGTGKEYSADIPIWGYDLVLPSEDWSAAHFVKFASRIILEIQQRQKLPIIVGGTGLYIKNLLLPPETLFIFPDQKLRQQLEKLSLTQLQNKLRRLNSNRFNQMNQSDRQNPRRLIRAVEIAKSQKGLSLPLGKDNPYRNTLHVGLTASIKQIDHRIEKRVSGRLKQGLEREVKSLADHYGWHNILSTTIAYQEWQPYFEKQTSLESVVETWTIHEKQYARNQLTWFKKQPNIHWFDITTPHFPDNIVTLVRKWYYD